MKKGKDGQRGDVTPEVFRLTTGNRETQRFRPTNCPEDPDQRIQIRGSRSEETDQREDLSMMKIFLLLMLPLMDGCKGASVKGCTGGWVEFTCPYPEDDERYESIYVITPRKTRIQSTQRDVWENKGSFSVYRDTRNKHLRVAIKELQNEDFGKYKCKFKPDKSSDSDEEDEVKVKDGENRCQEPFNQTAYRTAKTTITCDYRRNKDDSKVKFFCKDDGSVCDVILSTKSSLSSDGTFSLTETTSSFSMSISSVSPQHAGVYWCGLETNEGRYRAALKEIRLKVEVPPLTSTPSIISSPSPQPVTTSTDSSTQSSTASAVMHNDGVPWLPVTIAVVVCAVMLVLLLILVLGYKRLQRSKNTTNEGAQNNEDGAYEEIQERPPKPGSGTALKTIYATANAPTDPSASHYYSTVNFPHSPGEASGDSTVTGTDQCPTYSTVNNPSTPPEDPL